ncbi:MAG: GNAT family N-acetyltransferase [SAR202 cluster bacterium]|jgi:RimJ/RimL family protein N-acetyltransferase|nr:GNAT family N-acetyltransferase [Chloroflexota bacterium]MDP6420927.1 GNAT family protein [SAR202 cluster bacterium]HAL47272.1 GNAT family N-acetyltransferase [Dehalococcoidia bacterium]MDP6665129.1 GNAT family protein [SAR202 cluster bacterium]MDP6801342.1 GNAT family protein [SAR202 cluster bacterium]|tara:strand:+ start:1466 stop:2053 length:588 start_codon:yes stop_codon:yes gene_type:complete
MDRSEFDILKSKRLVLRHFRDSDLEPFLAHRNDPEVSRYQIWDSIDRQEASDFIQEQMSRQPGVAGQGFQFAVEMNSTGELIGDCYLKIKDEDWRQAEIGVTLAPEHQGAGFAAEAVSSVLDYVFTELNLHRVVAVTDCENDASVALLERLGMRREGHFIENIWFKGRWGDEFQYAILKDEWLALRGLDSQANAE